MQINECFTFGKYKGLVIKDVYQGNNQISKQLIKNYIQEKVLASTPIVIDDANYQNILEFMSFEINDEFLRATPISHNKKEWVKLIEGILRNGNTLVDRLIGNININNCSNSIESGNKREIIDADPEYLMWCIGNIDIFHIDPEEIKILQHMNVYRFNGIKLIHKRDDIYGYEPNISTVKFRFSNRIIEQNRNKFDANFNSGEDFDDYFDDNLNSWGECGACLESPCRCSDRD